MSFIIFLVVLLFYYKNTFYSQIITIQRLMFYLRLISSPLTSDLFPQVHIIGHIPPGISDCLKGWSWNYYKVVSRSVQHLSTLSIQHRCWCRITVNPGKFKHGKLENTPNSKTTKVTRFLSLYLKWQILTKNGKCAIFSREKCQKSVKTLHLSLINLPPFPLLCIKSINSVNLNSVNAK